MMKKIVLLAFVLLLSSMSMLGTKLVITVSGLTTHHVYSGQSIQDAINSAQSGDTIFVYNGTYYEHVVVNKSVSLIGEDKHNTIIDGNGTYRVIEVTASNVKIINFTIRRSGGHMGIYVRGFYSSGNNISHNIITDTYAGIYLSSSKNNTLIGNTVSNNTESGIYLDYSSNNTLIGNIASNNHYGIRLYKSNNNTLSGNTFSGDNVLTSTDLGIDLMYSSNNVVSGNIASNNTYGIMLYSSEYGNSENNTITGNTASNNFCGICLRDSDNNTISDNIASSNNGYGIWLDFSANNTVIGNTASNTTTCGIYLEHSSNNVISGNTVSNNTNGIYLEGGGGNTISGNTASSNNYDGIRLYISYPNVVSGNTASNNTNGIYLDASSDNVIFHNNFINNTNQVIVTPVFRANTWDDFYPSGGNYWSDYNRTDANHDGIGDTAYVINEYNQDNYPLMGMFSDFPVSYQEETYHVTTICNSTISDFQFNAVAKTISFNVTGPDYTLGICRVDIPNIIVQDLWQGNCTVLVDGEQPLTIRNWTDGTYTCIYFTYQHSEHEVLIVPEFPTWTSMLLILTVLTVVIIIYKRRLLKTPIH